ncbi:trihelix transcription factor DF1-like [Mercurialis annua]|uniref:trihelix transcription factor DF1-like n=1 Tax=Mercurialis annua TaxID=3986 RepID=UPI00215F2869|nr:trihelix transcription factor DF1-like [Mercurialis annua]
MQSSYGMPLPPEQFMENDDGCSSPVFPIQNPLQNLNYHYPPQQPPQPMPMTHQLFLNHQQNHFRPPIFHPDDRLQSQLQPPPPHQQTPFFPMKYQLGNKECGVNQRQQPHFVPTVMQQPHCWNPQKDSTSMKQPFWKQLNTSNNEEQEAVQVNNSKNRDNFDGLEAIYSVAKAAAFNQTGSGSALTGENSPENNVNLSVPFSAGHCTAAANTRIGVDHYGSENSIGEEASVMRRIKKRKLKENLSSISGFFENLVKQVTDHQDVLHRKFLEAIEKMEKDRTEREEEWKREESAKYNREAISRSHDQALASIREAQIVACIEKITGQSIKLPARKTLPLLQPEFSKQPTKDLTTNSSPNSRWPKAEVEGLIKARASIETKFQEPGLKGPLWEEVSSLMASMGYQRNAKRCKEKWENINKYYKKAKESSKKRSLQSKTCSYFNQLDQIYSTNCSVPLSSSDIIEKLQQSGYSELLEAFNVAGRDNNGSSKKIKVDEMGNLDMEFDEHENEEAYEDDHKDDSCYVDSTDEDQSGSRQ